MKFDEFCKKDKIRRPEIGLLLYYLPVSARINRFNRQGVPIRHHHIAYDTKESDCREEPSTQDDSHHEEVQACILCLWHHGWSSLTFKKGKSSPAKRKGKEEDDYDRLIRLTCQNKIKCWLYLLTRKLKCGGKPTRPSYQSRCGLSSMQHLTLCLTMPTCNSGGRWRVTPALCVERDKLSFMCWIVAEWSETWGGTTSVMILFLRW